MREPLYKAKAINRDPDWNYRTDYQNGDWVYGLVSKLYKYKDKCFAEMTNTDGVSGIDVDPETICEFTGLTDTNGNNAFESDIVKVKFWSDWCDGYEISNGVIQWKNGRFVIYISHYALYLELYKHPEMEIVGNIFENGDLK
jgi:YopX protein.